MTEPAGTRRLALSTTSPGSRPASASCARAVASSRPETSGTVTKARLGPGLATADGDGMGGSVGTADGDGMGGSVGTADGDGMGGGDDGPPSAVDAGPVETR
jgi:hypothetical protein